MIGEEIPPLFLTKGVIMFYINDVGKFCKVFRTEILKMTLEELSEKSGIKVTTLSSFENGRSRNLEHINSYLKFANEEQAKLLRENIPYKVGD